MTLFVKTWGKMSPAEQKAFVELVETASEVEEGVAERAKGAAHIVLLFEGGELIGSAAVKQPPADRRARVFKKAGLNVAAADVPYELGWIVVAEGQLIARLSPRRIPHGRNRK
jgi:hypothetical protein